MTPGTRDGKEQSLDREQAASPKNGSASPPPALTRTDNPTRSLSSASVVSPSSSSSSFTSSDPDSGSEADKPQECHSLDRDPTEIMAKIFPHYTRQSLESMVRTCKGDVVRSIELLLHAREAKIDGDASARSSLSCPLRPPAALPGAHGALGGKSAFSPLHVPPAAAAAGDSLYSLSPRLGVSPLRLTYSPAGGAVAGFVSPYMTPGLMPMFPLRPPLDSYSFPGIIRDFPYVQSKESLCSAGLYTQPNIEKL